jgi:hypothetical protein
LAGLPMNAMGRAKFRAYFGADVFSIKGHLSVPGREWQAAIERTRPLGEENCFIVSR